MRYPIRLQLVVSLLFLILTEILYRQYDPAAPFVKDQNFGSWMDMILMGKINPGGGWVTINCLPTAAHTIWGAICGSILLKKELSDQMILKTFLGWGLAALVLGYGLDWLSITPIVKRIATTSFVLASGGWCLWVLALFYWLVDMKKHRNWARMFVIVGTNSIFIYLFAEVLGRSWLTQFVAIFNDGFLSMIGVPTSVQAVTGALITLAIMWYLCYWLFKRAIFFKI